MENVHYVSDYLCDDLVKELRSYLNNHPVAAMIKDAYATLHSSYGGELEGYGFSYIYFVERSLDD